MKRKFGADELLDCYRMGVFPMANAQDDPRLYIMDPEIRGVLPLRGFHVPRSLAKTVRQDRFEICVDTAFARVVAACAEAAPNRPSTWINDRIFNLYNSLFAKGHAHSVECWNQGELVGGLYGVSLEAAFFGESMFSRATDASKVALVHLVARLIRADFRLLDSQFVNPHLDQFGAEAIDREEFHRRLAEALAHPADFRSAKSPLSGQEALQLITQTS